MKENADSPENMSDDEDLSSDQEILNIENNPDYLSNSKELLPTPPQIQTKLAPDALNFHCQCKCHLMESYMSCNCSCDEKLSKCSELNEDDCENIDIISIIKFCNQSKQIVFPAQVFLKK